MADIREGDIVASCEVDLIGMDKLINKLNEIGRKGTEAMTKALEKGAEPILESMKNTDMFEDHSGDLRKSLKVSKVKTRKNGKFIWIGDVDREAPHGWYVENGTSDKEARPFMRTAYREEKEKALGIIKEEMTNAFKDLSKGE